MTFTIQIQPGSPFGADKDERLSDARLLASEVGQLEGVEKAEYSETVQKAHGLENPIVVTAVITGSFLIVTTLIDNLFRLLREKRKKGKYEAFSLQIHNHYYHLADDTEAPVKAEIEKLIEDADKRTVTLETKVKSPLMEMYLEPFKAAAGEGAALELKMRLLAGKIPALQKYAHQRKLGAIETDLLRQFDAPFDRR